MEKTKTLGDVIGDLIERGYSLDFQAVEQAKYELGEERVQILPANGFKIDEVYCCEDGSSDFMYVFAVSSMRYRMKGILINAVTTETSITVGDILKKIGNAFAMLLGCNRKK